MRFLGIAARLEPTIAGVPHRSVWPGLYAAILQTCDGAFQSSCDAGKLHAMLCDVNSNMFNILLALLEYLSN